MDKLRIYWSWLRGASPPNKLVAVWKNWYPAIIGAVTSVFLIGLMIDEHFFAFVTFDRVAVGLSSLTGTFVGAWIAFRFNKLRADQERVQEDVLAGNFALFMLAAMLSEVRDLIQNITADFRGRNDAWLNMPTAMPLDPTLELDHKSLTFLLQADAKAYQNLFLETRRYARLAHVVSLHAEYREHAHSSLQKAGMRSGEQRTESEIVAAFGEKLVGELKSTSGAMIEFADEDAASYPATFALVRKALKSIFPNESFIDLSDDQASTESQPPATPAQPKPWPTHP